MPTIGEIASVSDEVRRKFHGSKFLAVGFKGSRFRGARLSFAIVQETDFTKCNFNNAKCVGTMFDDCLLGETDFSFADCRKAHFNQCELVLASFRDADCADVIFNVGPHSSIHAVLAGCSFVNTKLDRAKFECVLRETDFKGASLIETDFSEASGLKEEELTKAKTLYHAKFRKDLAAELHYRTEWDPH